MNIYHSSDGEYQCEAIMDLSKQSFDKFVSHKKTDDMSLKEIYNRYIKDLRSPYFVFSGEVSLMQDTVMINLRAEKNAFSRILTIRRFDRISNCKKYQGSIGTMLSTIYADKCTKFQHIGISVTEIQNVEDFKPLFKFNQSSEYVIISDINEVTNQQWFDSVVQEQNIP